MGSNPIGGAIFIQQKAVSYQQSAFSEDKKIDEQSAISSQFSAETIAAKTNILSGQLKHAPTRTRELISAELMNQPDNPPNYSFATIKTPDITPQQRGIHGSQTS